MRLVLISDTHGLHARMPAIPEGDVLLHAGDLTMRGTLPEMRDALTWFDSLPHRLKNFVGGNHDFLLEREPALARSLIPGGVTYLEGNGVLIDGVRLGGSPYQPAFFDWAFNLPRGEALARVWQKIPNDTQVLLTHAPPYGIRDRVLHRGGLHVGCEDLRSRVDQLEDLRLHVFRHIHEAYGTEDIGECRFVNASCTTVHYDIVNPPVVVDL